MFTKSLDSILATFTKVQKNLAEFIVAEGYKADIKESQIAELKNDVSAHNQNIIKAGKIQANLDKILG